MLWGRGDRPGRWVRRENKAHAETGERRGRREVRALGDEMESREPQETLDLQDLQDPTDHQALAEISHLRWREDLMTKRERLRWG